MLPRHLSTIIGSGETNTMEDRRQKYAPKNNDTIKLDIKFDITELDLMCGYIVSENRSIRRGNIVNLMNVFKLINMSVYGNDQACIERIDFINKGINARLKKNLSTTFTISREINGGIGTENTINYPELSNTEVEWVNQCMSEILKYANIESNADEGLNLLTKLKSSDYTHRGDVVKNLEGWLSKVQNLLRKSKMDSIEDLTFSLSGNNFIEAMTETHKQAVSPSNVLVFGTQALNMLTGGGLFSTRVYTTLGLPGEGKSSTMLDWAIQLKRYNVNYKCKDPTKRPCVVLFVMENSIIETVERLFSMCIIGKHIDQFSLNEAINIMQDKGLHVSDDDPIDLVIKYKPILSVDTSYLYTLVDDLEDEGYEVICVLQDYLKRIHSVEGTFNGDLRAQLGAIVNEFKVFATIKNIPVVTASQLNRTATNSIDTARVKNKSDLVRLIGRANVGESNLILENSDWIALIAPEQDRVTGQRFLGMQRVKSRYFIRDDFHYAYIPYINDSIKFVEDIGGPAMHRESMGTEIELNTGISGASVGNINEVKSLVDINGNKLPAEDPASNLFNNAKFVSRIMVNAPALCYVNPCTNTVYHAPKAEKVKMYSLVKD